MRKPGKLPAALASVSYELEYGQGALELHHDPSVDGHRVAIVDDLIATGGTAKAAARLIANLGGIVAGYAFVIKFSDLGGRKQLGDYPVSSLIRY